MVNTNLRSTSVGKSPSKRGSIASGTCRMFSTIHQSRRKSRQRMTDWEIWHASPILSSNQIKTSARMVLRARWSSRISSEIVRKIRHKMLKRTTVTTLNRNIIRTIILISTRPLSIRIATMLTTLTNLASLITSCFKAMIRTMQRRLHSRRQTSLLRKVIEEWCSTPWLCHKIWYQEATATASSALVRRITGVNQATVPSKSNSINNRWTNRISRITR